MIKKFKMILKSDGKSLEFLCEVDNEASEGYFVNGYSNWEGKRYASGFSVKVLNIEEPFSQFDKIRKNAFEEVADRLASRYLQIRQVPSAVKRSRLSKIASFEYSVIKLK